MAMSISNQMIDEGPEIHYSRSFRNTLETHLKYLREHPDSDYLPVEAHIAHKYQADFYGLLRHYRVAEEIHWLILRLNGYTSPTQYDSDLFNILVPSNDAVLNIRKAFRTSNKSN